MIVKSLSRKSGSSQLLRYIFRYMLSEKKRGIDTGQKDQERRGETFLHTNPMADYKWKLNLPPGVFLRKKDLQYLIEGHYSAKIHS